jgi:hypothetical protein
MAGLQVHPVTDDNRFAERQSRLRAVPVYEFIDGVAIAPLRIWTRQAIDNCGLRNFKVRQPQN